MPWEIRLTTVLRITDGIILLACWFLVEVRNVLLQVLLRGGEGTEGRILFRSAWSLPLFLFIVKLGLPFLSLDEVNLDSTINSKRLDVDFIGICDGIVYQGFPGLPSSFGTARLGSWFPSEGFFPCREALLSLVAFTGIEGVVLDVAVWCWGRSFVHHSNIRVILY